MFHFPPEKERMMNDEADHYQASVVHVEAMFSQS